MASIEGIASEIVKLAPIVTQTEKDVIRLQEADKQIPERLKAVEGRQDDFTKDFKDSRKTDQAILVAIGVAAVGAQILIPIFLK